MKFRRLKTWSYPGALLDALVDTQKVVSQVELPLPIAHQGEDAAELLAQVAEQLRHHLIPRVRERASPALVVVAGSTGAGKSTLVNSLLGQPLTDAGVLRPTTLVPHVFYHPLDAPVLSEVARKARIFATEQVPRGLAIVDSPDLDSVRDENRAIARELLHNADLWLFTTTASRYGDALPWEALTAGDARGASIAIVLNRVTPAEAGQVRSAVTARMQDAGLSHLPLFVIPESNQAQIPLDVERGIGRWLSGVAAAAAEAIISRTLQGSLQTLNARLTTVADLMDSQGEVAKELRRTVRRVVARSELTSVAEWLKAISTGPMQGRWDTAVGAHGPLLRLKANWWNTRRHRREEKEQFFHQLRPELLQAVEAQLLDTANQAHENLLNQLAELPGPVGLWLVQQLDQQGARVLRERRCADAARAFLAKCDAFVAGHPQIDRANRVVGPEGVGLTLASAAVGIGAATHALSSLLGTSAPELIALAETELVSARHSILNQEALITMKPIDVASLLPGASAQVNLRLAELRGLL